MTAKVLIFLCLLSLLEDSFFGLSVRNKTRNFSKCYRYQRFTYENLAGRVKVLICTGTKNGVPHWQYSDGSSTLGEMFNPAKDCSDIVDHLPEAKNGFYWIALNNKAKHKVWCDLHTDGGGFMLVGMKDNPKTWTVPSNPTPVHPQGPPHWSSALGNVTVLDFRVQISTEKSFGGTKANWFYRLNQLRELGDLFTNKNGCPFLQPGIGNIKFVKDVMTKSVLSNKFKCSKFGQHVHSLLGWAKMNYCLRRACKDGYAVFSDGVPIILDKFGSYSYSAVSSFSGMNHNSTAFVGCDRGKCCACFGPKGGRRNYCGPQCTAVNGGTVTKEAFVWFWVRTRIPERVWKKCTEILVKNSSSGKREKHFIDPQTGTPRKGSCSEQFKALLNEGTLSVSDEESFEKIPNVTGLLAYRKDNKKLFVNQGSQWQALGTQKEVQELEVDHKAEMKRLKELVNQTNKALDSQDKEMKKLEAKVLSDLQDNKTQTQANEIRSQRKKIDVLERKVEFQKSEGQSQDAKILTQKNKIESMENKYQNVVTRLKNLELLNMIYTCTALRQKNASLPSGPYYLTHDGTSFPVHCDMTAENGVGVTVIGHDSEARTEVDGYEDPQSYRRKIKYDINMKQIVAIINRSHKCKQFIRYDCLNAALLLGDVPSISCWISRQGKQMSNWGGAPTNSGKCACRLTYNCRDVNARCNCDQNDNVWSEDSGFLDDKSVLPVTELRFGDTSALKNGDDEKGYHTLGKLLCWG